MPPNTPDWMRPPDWMALGNPGKIVGFDPNTGQFLEASAGLGNPGKIVGFDLETGQFLEAAAGYGYHGLGKVYPVTLPVIGATTIDVPVEQIVHDAYDATLTEMWTRTKKNWLYIAGGALLIGAVVMMSKAK